MSEVKINFSYEKDSTTCFCWPTMLCLIDIAIGSTKEIVESLKRVLDENEISFVPKEENSKLIFFINNTNMCDAKKLVWNFSADCIVEPVFLKRFNAGEGIEQQVILKLLDDQNIKHVISNGSLMVAKDNVVTAKDIIDNYEKEN